MSTSTFDLSLSSKQIASNELVSLLRESGLKRRTVMRKIVEKSPNQKARKLIWEMACDKPDSLTLDEWLGYGAVTIIIDAKESLTGVGSARLKDEISVNLLSKKLKRLFNNRKGMEFFDAACQSVNLVVSPQLAKEVLEVDGGFDTQFVNSVMREYEVKLADRLVRRCRGGADVKSLAKRYSDCPFNEAMLPRVVGKSKKRDFSAYKTKSEFLPFFSEFISERVLEMQEKIMN